MAEDTIDPLALEILGASGPDDTATPGRPPGPPGAEVLSTTEDQPRVMAPAAPGPRVRRGWNNPTPIPPPPDAPPPPETELDPMAVEILRAAEANRRNAAANRDIPQIRLPSGAMVPDAGALGRRRIEEFNEGIGQPRVRAGPPVSVYGPRADVTLTPPLRGIADIGAGPNFMAWLGERGSALASRGINYATGTQIDPENNPITGIFRRLQSIAPNSEQLRASLFSATGVRETNHPDAAMRVLNTGQEMGVGALIPTQGVGWGRRMATNGAIGTLAGLASGTAGEVWSGSEGEPYARAGFAASVPFLAAAMMTVHPSVAMLLRRQLRGMSEVELQSADHMLRDSHARGNPLTATEALQAVRGQPNTLLQGVQREVGSSVRASDVMDDFMHNRANANRSTLEEGLAPLEGRTPAPREFAPVDPAYALTDTRPPRSTPGAGPAMPPSDPAALATLPNRLQSAAEGAVGDARAARNAATRPLFAEAIEQMHAPTPAARDGLNAARTAIADAQQHIADLAAQTQNPTLLALLQSHNLDEVLTRFSQSLARGAPGSNAGRGTNGTLPLFEHLNNTRADLVEALGRPHPPGGATLPSEIARKLESTLDEMFAGIERASDTAGGGTGMGAFGRGMHTYRQATREGVAPLVDGTTGKVASASSGTTQSNTLFGASPRGGAMPQTPESVAASLRAIGAQPDGARIVRDHISNMLREAFEDAAKRKAGRVENPHSGAEFAASVAGNAEQRAVLEAAVRTLPHGEEAWAGLKRMFDLFDAHQYTPMPNSTGEARSIVRNSLRTNSDQMMPKGGTIATRVFDATVKLFDDSFREGNTHRLARLLTSPDGITRLRALSRANGLKPRENMVFQGLLDAYHSTDDNEHHRAGGGRVGYADGGDVVGPMPREAGDLLMMDPRFQRVPLWGGGEGSGEQPEYMPDAYAGALGMTGAGRGPVGYGGFTARAPLGDNGEVRAGYRGSASRTGGQASAQHDFSVGATYGPFTADVTRTQAKQANGYDTPAGRRWSGNLSVDLGGDESGGRFSAEFGQNRQGHRQGTLNYRLGFRRGGLA